MEPNKTNDHSHTMRNTLIPIIVVVALIIISIFFSNSSAFSSLKSEQGAAVVSSVQTKVPPVSNGERVVFYNNGTCAIQTVDPVTGTVTGSVTGTTQNIAVGTGVGLSTTIYQVCNTSKGRVAPSDSIDQGQANVLILKSVNPPFTPTTYDIVYNDDGSCTVGLTNPVTGETTNITGVTQSYVKNGVTYLHCNTGFINQGGDESKNPRGVGEKSITPDSNSTIPKQPNSPARVVSFLSGTIGAPCIIATFDDNTGDMTDLVIGTEGADYSCNEYVLNPDGESVSKTYKIFGSKITSKHYKVLQTYFSSKGLLPEGYSTGKRDTKTRTALKAYQKSIGVTASGSLSTATKAKLNMELSQLFKPVTKAIDNSQTMDQGEKAVTLPTNTTFPTIPLRIVWVPMGSGVCSIWDLNDETGVGSYIGLGNIMTTNDGIDFCGQVSSVAINLNIGSGSTFIKDFSASSKDTFANKLLQSTLKAGGYFSGKVDGSFGSATQTALKAFQKKAGIPQTGVVDQATREKLNSNVKYTVGSVKF